MKLRLQSLYTREVGSPFHCVFPQGSWSSKAGKERAGDVQTEYNSIYGRGPQVQQGAAGYFPSSYWIR